MQLTMMFWLHLTHPQSPLLQQRVSFNLMGSQSSKTTKSETPPVLPAYEYPVQPVDPKQPNIESKTKNIGVKDLINAKVDFESITKDEKLKKDPIDFFKHIRQDWVKD